MSPKEGLSKEELEKCLAWHNAQMRHINFRREYENSKSKEDFWDWLKVNHPEEFDKEDEITESPKPPKLSLWQRILKLFK